MSRLEREGTTLAQRGGNRNHKLAAKAARRKAIVTAKKQVELLGSSPSGRIVKAAAGPVVHCLRTAAIFEAGMGHLVLARQLPAGSLGCGFFLVDLLCLGVKDVFYEELSPSEMKTHLDRLAAGGEALVEMEPAAAKKLITGAVAFATASGLHPHKDYPMVVKLFAGIDAAASPDAYVFGKDGVPVYMPGPNDSPARIREIERRLNHARGEQGWDVPHPSDDPTLQKIIAALQNRFSDDEDDDALVIEHEDPAEPTDARAPE